MSSASVRTRLRRPRRVQRLAAWIAACATGSGTSGRFVAWFAVIHVVLWSLILGILKRNQDVHFDIAEAYAWGQQFLLGYGKHPPLSGWVAGIWFRLLPVADWSAYALAMAVAGLGMWISWLIALRVVDRRRAFLTVVMLAIYPIFNFKGFKYNADLIQLVTMPLLVLAYLNAFERRTWQSGVWLGLAAALALLAKYWALTIIGAIGLAALLHPQRMAFLRSPAPWVAIGVLLVAIAPHLWWLKQVDFLPLTYAGGVYEISSRLQSFHLAAGYINHNIALLLLPIAFAALALIHVPWRSSGLPWSLTNMVTQAWSRGANSGVRLSPAIQIWLIQAIAAVGPPLGGVALKIYMKTDWGIPLFFLTPLALVAMPHLRVTRIALFRIVAVWLLASLVVLAASPWIASRDTLRNVNAVEAYDARSELARNLTQQWRLHFNSRWRAVAGSTRVADVMAFYSPDHPTPFAPNEPSAGLITLAEAKHSGFIGICDPTAPDHAECTAWMKINAASAEQMILTTRRFFQGKPQPAMHWEVYIVPPSGPDATAK